MSHDREPSGANRKPMSPATSGPRPGTTLRWTVNLAYAVILVIMAVVPSTPRIAQLSMPDWCAHAAAYGLQAALLFWACRPSFSRGRAMVLGVVGASAFGMATEALQILQPERSVELKDLVANSAGALLICVVIAVAGRLTGRRGR